MRDTRHALIETTHWHLPLYLDALKRPDVRVAGVTDSAGQTGEAIAAQFGCPVYGSIDELIAAVPLDFAFVFGWHADMPTLGHAMMAHGIPFAIEKPCGIRAADVTALATEAERAGLYVAVPFILRMTDAVKIMAAECARSGAVDHMITGAHLLRGDDRASAARTAESKDRKDIEQPARWIILIEACVVEAFEQPLAFLRRDDNVKDASAGRYLLEHTRLKTAAAAGQRARCLPRQWVRSCSSRGKPRIDGVIERN